MEKSPNAVSQKNSLGSPLRTNIVDDQSKALKEIENLSEKELLQHIALYNKQTLEEVHKIKNNIKFFFWLTVMGIVIAFIKSGDFF